MRGIPLLLALVLVLVLGGCAHVGAVAGKTVSGKAQPNRLIAADGSECVVSEARFDSTEIGTRVLCAWRGRAQPRPGLAVR